MQTLPKRQYTQEFQESAMKQVLDGGRSLARGRLEFGDVGEDLGQWGQTGAAGATAFPQWSGTRRYERAGRTLSPLVRERTIEAGQGHCKKGSGVRHESVAMRDAWIQHSRDISPVAGPVSSWGVLGVGMMPDRADSIGHRLAQKKTPGYSWSCRPAIVGIASVMAVPG